MNPKYPIYIPSRGRWQSRFTSKALEKMNVPYYIVIEKEEYSAYASVISPAKILVLPFSGKGLVPSRNWIKQHSISKRAKRHWQIDDNISGFVRLNNNRKIKVASGTIFKAAEDFVDRYENVAIAGFNYDFFCKRKQKLPPYYPNTRIYSCSLVLNSAPYDWRGVFNDDTDICLRVLKDGWCTVQFNAFLQMKAQTMTTAGGLNTEEYYKQDDGRLKFAESLVNQHPECVRLTWKFGRWHHQVDYSWFIKHNKLKFKDDYIKKQGINNYGMILRTI